MSSRGLTGLVGILLVLMAIPLGFMLAPLVVGAVVLALALRAMDRSLQPVPRQVG